MDPLEISQTPRADEEHQNEIDEQPPETYPEDRPGNKDFEEEDPLEKQRKREKKEFIAVLVVAFVILVIVVVTVSVVVVQNQDRKKAEEAAALVPTAAPTAASTSNLVDDPQDKLDYLFWDIENNQYTAPYAAELSKTASDLQGKYQDDSGHPVKRAMSWLLDADTNNQQDNLLRRLGLASVFYANGGNGWLNSSNWLTSESHCNWMGVVCCSDNNLDTLLPSCAADKNAIFQLDLSDNNVTGSLSNVFTFLHDLQSLDLSNNSLVGTLPGSLGTLPHLVELSLQHNQLTGTIPGSIADNVLDTLFVQRNMFTGDWPRELCQDHLETFGFDCAEVSCPDVICCPPTSSCYAS